MTHQRILLLLLVSIIVLTSCTTADRSLKPEKQISFSKETKSHSYYVRQAELWWKEIEKDITSEMNWYNYYRACRNAQGTADWSEDFVKESPFLRLGQDIVLLMEKNIPGTFIYHFVKGSTGGVDPTAGKDLIKAYRMKPNFPRIHPIVITYATSTFNHGLREEANMAWYKSDELNPGLLLYARNVLKSVRSNGILLTQHDNDTYPVWMLQDVEDLRSDVEVINIDFLLLEDYRKKVFKKIGVPPYHLDSVNINDYRENWSMVIRHLLKYYPQKRPLHIGLTVSSEWYKGFEDSLHLVGLTWLYTDNKIDENFINTRLIREEFNLDNLNSEFEGYAYQQNVINMNVNYLRPLKILFNEYLKAGNESCTQRIREIALKIASRTNDNELMKRVMSDFYP